MLVSELEKNPDNRISKNRILQSKDRGIASKKYITSFNVGDYILNERYGGMSSDKSK